ncbi:MAG: Coenzyme F420 hydrogenase/dehydrogenase, beta subunit C-terminal domain [Bdellovibrionales bacterium]|nr:Coenzyme F420 hydrogenase/dehydrogenase, beta subunit C-terminal domain [Bdellovibrionales bacterium]
MSDNALPILDEQASLRAPSPFLSPVHWPPQESQEQPRALRGLARIVDGGLCHRCGSCVGICPTRVLGLSEQAYPTIENLSACTDCDLCVKVCPGDEFHYERVGEEMFGASPDLTDIHGVFQKAVLAYATHSSLRETSTSGGLVTGILLDLLERGEIDGAVVIASDDEHLWKGKPVIARTEGEILAATKSKYAISPTNAVFQEILEVPGRYALVGLPCQIHGYHKACELDARLKERVVLTIGLFCHAAIEHEAFEIIWQSLGEKATRAKRFISRVGKHPGAPHIELEDGSLYPVYFGNRSGFRPSSMEMINILYRLYTPPRCLTCFDALAEFADISVGDPWMAPPDEAIDFHDGYSFGLLRTDRGKEIFERSVTDGQLVSYELTEHEARQCNKKMATEKKWRAFRVIETQRRQGKSLPSYGDPMASFPRHSGLQFLETEGNMLTHILCFLPRYRASVLRFFLGGGGYWLLWFNNKRRRVKFWLRDSLAKMKRGLYGRK